MTASDAAASITSDSLMPPTPSWMTSTVISLLRQLRDLVLERLERAGHVGLDDQGRLAPRPSSCARAQTSSSETRTPRAARQRLALQPVLALGGLLARLALVLDDAHDLAGVGHAVEAEHLDRHAGRGLVDLLAAEVLHRAHLGPRRRRPPARRRRAACRAAPAPSRPGRGPDRAATRRPCPTRRRPGWPSAPGSRRA